MTVLPAFVRCPRCRGSLAGIPCKNGAVCPQCSWLLEVVGGVPVLVPSVEAVRAQIDQARASGRAAWYDEPQAEHMAGPYRHHLAKRRRYVEGVLTEFARETPGPIALDLGCGDGDSLGWLSTMVGRVHASDYNLDRLTRATSHARGGLVFMADATDYPSADSMFDVVYCNHVLEHIRDDARALSEVSRVLRPGGMLILGVPNEGAAFWRLAYALEPWSRRRTDHVQFYTASSIAALCESQGLRVEHVEPIGWGIPSWTVDAAVRRFRAIDDLLERVGRRWLRRQATSLYVIARSQPS